MSQKTYLSSAPARSQGAPTLRPTQRIERIQAAVRVAFDELARFDRALSERAARPSAPQLYEAACAIVLQLRCVQIAECFGRLPSEDLGAQPVERLHLFAQRLRKQRAAAHGGLAWAQLRALSERLNGPGLGGWPHLPQQPLRAARFPWLWASAARPPVDDGAMRRIYEQLQIGEVGAQTVEVEWLGQGYEAMLAHTGQRSDALCVVFKVRAGRPAAPVRVEALEAIAQGGREALVDFLQGHTGRSRGLLARQLGQESARPEGLAAGHWQRVAAYAPLLAQTPEGALAVYPPGEPMIVRSEARRGGGVHYTPPEVTQQIVEACLRRALDAQSAAPPPGAMADAHRPAVTPATRPLTGASSEPTAQSAAPTPGAMADARPPQPQWRAQEILSLRLCDPAMGAGGFLLQSCRFLAEALTRVWAAEGVVPVRALQATTAAPCTESMPPSSPEGALSTFEKAAQLIATHCLYGVDLDEQAVHLAQLSLWLLTGLAPNPQSPWTSHLQQGDALVGLAPALTEPQLTTPSHSPHLSTEPAQPDHSASSPQLGGSTPDPLGEAPDFTALAPHGVAFHWARAFPEIWSAPRRGFDVILTNPPFLNAIEHSESRSQPLKAYYTKNWPLFARGAFDLSLLFWARSAQDLLQPRGHYGILLPTTLLSQQAGWQRWLHTHWRPREILLYGVDRFQAARIRTAALIGTAEEAATVDLRSEDPQVGLFEIRGQRWSPHTHSWYEQIASSEEQVQRRLRPAQSGEAEQPGMATQPGGALQPGEAEQPGMATQPGGALQPGEAVQSGDTLHPSETAQSGDTLHPSETAQSGDTLQPGEAAQSSDALQPGEAAQSGVAAQPSAAAQSGEAAQYGAATQELSHFAHVWAGCTTGDAYRLKPVIHEAAEGSALRLITTGSLDRYVCKWGQMNIRFLKGDYRHPRWPLAPADRGLARALDRQRGVKILVGGLTAILEAWLDAHSQAAGVVQTWALRPHGLTPEAPAQWQDWWLCAILNSAPFSRIFVRRFGAYSMSGQQITIRKASLLQMAIPIAQHSTAPTAIPEALQRPERASPAALGALLTRLSQSLQECALDAPHRDALDKLAHLTAALLYGQSLEAAERDYLWWCQRARLTPHPHHWAELSATCAPLLS